jgi:hypothetical protein
VPDSYNQTLQLMHDILCSLVSNALNTIEFYPPHPLPLVSATISSVIAFLEKYPLWILASISTLLSAGMSSSGISYRFCGRQQ